MNVKSENVFKDWLKLNEDEKRDFVKEILNFNNLSLSEKSSIIKNYEKSV